MTAEFGIAMMVATTATFAASDSVVKAIGASVPLLALLFGRYSFQAVALGAWQARRGAGHFRKVGVLKLQFLRAFFLLVNSACTFAGLRYLPLPVTTSLAMMAPLISTLLAAILLNEDVTKSKWSMVVLGFIGMLIVVQPGSGEFSWAVAFPIGAATTFACFQVVSSRLSTAGDPITTNLITAVVASIALAGLLWVDQADLLPAIRKVTVGSWLMVLAMGFLSTLGHLLMLQALRRTPLAVLTPFGYAQLAFATLFSWAFFGRVPSVWTAVGMIVIAVSGLGTIVLHARGRALPA
ncbi:DMT family transporter [Paraburkholderia sp. Ac-20336]|nr:MULTISPECIES: DMT family transporter [Burkholderiaceae]MBN3801692.1 DMT family transporter [Paraburkholderia sp. Ac-20336]MBN3845654.1 DMT family transporter [Paraburkholderia sp. Ac-20342]NIF51092.1 DMT family transporter [Burkholderia sp. Ax-1724]NIF75929.1 DMT family transporter [Paraburkholderia sp. Cy-641]